MQVPLPIPIPIDRIRRELEAAAARHKFGSVELIVFMTPSSAEKLELLVHDKDSVRGSGEEKKNPNVVIDPERRAIVDKVIGDISFRAGLRTKLCRIVAHYQDGKILNWEFEGER